MAGQALRRLMAEYKRKQNHFEDQLANLLLKEEKKSRHHLSLFTFFS